MQPIKGVVLDPSGQLFFKPTQILHCVFFLFVFFQKREKFYCPLHDQMKMKIERQRSCVKFAETFRQAVITVYILVMAVAVSSCEVFDVMPSTHVKEAELALSTKNEEINARHVATKSALRRK